MSFGKFARKEDIKRTNKSLLLVCEGARTEPTYFKSFRIPSRVIEICGTGVNTLSLVKHAVHLSKLGQYDEVWCVFDRDSFPKKNITAAFQLIKECKFKVAFSNESFELWYLLHFCYMDAQITRAQYCTKLSEYLEFNYQKNNPKMYDLLLDRQKEAIKHAKRLEKAQPLQPGKEWSSIPTTSVYKLVERLNKMALEYEKK
jgi:hypothetical protein